MAQQRGLELASELRDDLESAGGGGLHECVCERHLDRNEIAERRAAGETRFRCR